MQTVSDLFKSKIKEASREFECKITIGDRVFTNEDLVDIKIFNGIPGDGFMIGATPSATLDLTLLNRGDTIYSTNQIKLEVGVNIGSKFEYLLMGKFNIDEIEKTDYTVKFTAYDNMIKFESAYFSTLGDKPTLQQVVSELASKTGVQFTGSLPSYTVKKLEGFTCREVLGYVASLCGGNALITRDGKFTIVTPKDVGYTITPDNYIPPFNLEEVKYKVGKVSCQVGEEVLSKGTLGTDSMELQFENPWITETILTDIYNKLNGFNYLGYSLKWQGDISLDIGDIVSVTDIRGVVRKLPILNQELNYIGGLTSTISAKGETKNKNSFNSSGSIGKKVERVVTEVAIVNKAFIDYANINDANIKNLQAETAKIHNLEVETANINNILAGNIGSGSIQTIHLTGKNVVIDNAVIKSAMIDSLDLSKLKAGDISTNKFRITSDNGGIEIVGATQQFKDKNNKVRIQMGQDTQGNFNFILRGADGTTTLIDHTGIKEKAIADDLIKSNMISENAVGEKQINYSSLVTGLNKDDNTSLIKASKVAIDLEGQSLEVAFSNLKSNVDNIEIGGRNLIIKSAEASVSANSLISKSFVFIDNILQKLNSLIGKTVILSVDIEINNCIGPASNGRTRLGTEIRVTYIDDTNEYISCWYAPQVGESIARKRIKSTPFTISKEIKAIAGAVYIQAVSQGSIVSKPKLEVGTKCTDWTPAPEDVDQVTQSLQTQITANIKGIETLVKDTTIKQDGNKVSLQDFYTTFKQTSESVGVKISSLESVGFAAVNLQKVSGGKYRDSSSVAWEVNGLAPGDYFKSSGGDRWADAYVLRLNAKGNTATVYSKYPIQVEGGTKYTLSLEYGTNAINVSPIQSRIIIQKSTNVDDETKWETLVNINIPYTNAVWTKKSATFTTDKNTKGIRIVFQTQSGDAAYVLYFDKIMITKGDREYDWSPNEEDVQSRFNSVEQKITATALTTTITEAINAGTNSLTTMQFVLDKNGTTIKNGALKILNTAGDTVFNVDTDGNALVRGNLETHQGSTWAIKANRTVLLFNDWEGGIDKAIGSLYSSRRNGDATKPMLAWRHEGVSALSIAYRNNDSYYSYMDFDYSNILGDTKTDYPIRFKKGIDMRSAGMGMQFSYSRMYETGANRTLVADIYTGQRNMGGWGLIDGSSGRWILCAQPGNVGVQFFQFSDTVKFNYAVTAASLVVTGSKQRIIETEEYGTLGFNAYETATPYFGDIGRGKTNKEGICIIHIDELFKMGANTDIEYEVFLQKRGKGDIWIKESNPLYFIVEGTPSLEFSWELKAIQRDYEEFRYYGKDREVNRNEIDWEMAEANKRKVSRDNLVTSIKNIEEINKNKYEKVKEDIRNEVII